MYDLTVLLTTIAAASASFIAILGGLVANKLLSINGERDLLLDKMAINKSKADFLKEKIEAIQTELIEADALDFIRDNMDDLFANVAIELVYKQTETYSICFDDIKPYWNNALAVFNAIKTKLTKTDNTEQLNRDNVPISIAEALKDNYFDYEVCKMIMDYIDESVHVPYQRNGVMWYRDKQSELQKYQNELDYIELENKSLKEKEILLKKPKGIKVALIIFAVFACSCIILPLVLVPFQTTSFCLYITVKIISIFVFAFGLLSTLCYLIYLLKWNK